MMRNTRPKNIQDQIFSNQLFFGGGTSISPPHFPRTSVFQNALLFLVFTRKWHEKKLETFVGPLRGSFFDWRLTWEFILHNIYPKGGNLGIHENPNRSDTIKEHVHKTSADLALYNIHTYIITLSEKLDFIFLKYSTYAISIPTLPSSPSSLKRR